MVETHDLGSWCWRFESSREYVNSIVKASKYWSIRRLIMDFDNKHPNQYASLEAQAELIEKIKRVINCEN